MHIGVLGAGAWGTALAAHIAQQYPVTLWTRNQDVVDAINTKHENTIYLPGYQLPTQLNASSDFVNTLTRTSTGITIIATPLSGLAALCKLMIQAGTVPQQLVWVCKGIEPNSLALPHEIISRELGQTDCATGTLSGPSFAQEIASNLPCALVAASHSKLLQTSMQKIFHHHHMRIYTSTDVVGVELSGAVKNVLAIAAGISDGLKLGFNARAALLTRGLAEMGRLAHALGGQLETIMGLAGMGDLILTATGDLSRNRQVGLQLALGMTLSDILQQLGHVAEGVRCAQAVSILAKRHQIDMPICTAVSHILEGHISAREAVQQLLARDPK